MRHVLVSPTLSENRIATGSEEAHHPVAIPAGIRRSQHKAGVQSGPAQSCSAPFLTNHSSGGSFVHRCGWYVIRSMPVSNSFGGW